MKQASWYICPCSAGGNGKYWCIEEDASISASGSMPVDFFISLFDDAYFSLKTKGMKTKQTRLGTGIISASVNARETGNHSITKIVPKLKSFPLKRDVVLQWNED